MGIEEKLEQCLTKWKARASDYELEKYERNACDDAYYDFVQLKQSLPPEQKKVEVSELIDAWIKHARALNWGFYDLINPQYSNSHMARDIETWLESDKLNVELLAKAWFAADYTVKKEPLYYVNFGFDMYLIKGHSKLSDGTDHYWIESWCEIQQNGLEKLAQFTEKTIKSIDKDYWLFKVPVEEEGE